MQKHWTQTLSKRILYILYPTYMSGTSQRGGSRLLVRYSAYMPGTGYTPSSKRVYRLKISDWTNLPFTPTTHSNS